MHWSLQALCAPSNRPAGVDASLWTDPPPREKGALRSQWGTGEQKLAIRICGECPVWRECLSEALRFEASQDRSGRHGVWGGTTPAERARMTKRAQMRVRWAA